MAVRWVRGPRKHAILKVSCQGLLLIPLHVLEPKVCARFLQHRIGVREQGEPVVVVVVVVAA